MFDVNSDHLLFVADCFIQCDQLLTVNICIFDLVSWTQLKTEILLCSITKVNARSVARQLMKFK